MKAYERIFGSLPSKKTSSPIDKDDHLELDDSSLLDETDTRIYQSLIGSLQWAITLGRFDISVSVMVMSRFRSCTKNWTYGEVEKDLWIP